MDLEKRRENRPKTEFECPKFSWPSHGIVTADGVELIHMHRSRNVCLLNFDSSKSKK